MTDDPAIHDPPPVPRDLEARPERLVLVVRRLEDARYLFARWPDWPHPAMLSTVPPSSTEGLAQGIASLVAARMGVRVTGEPRPATERRPARLHHPYAGSDGLGWLRPVAVDVFGEPRADALLDDVISLTRAEALAQLPTDLERVLFRAGSALLDDRAAAGPSPDLPSPGEPGTDANTAGS